MSFKIRYRQKQGSLRQFLSDVIYQILQMVVLLFVMMIINLAVCGIAVVHGESMEPTLEEGDFLFCWKLYEPERFDVVLCRTGKGYEKELVKRVIGLPGDEIYIDQNMGLVYVNGTPIEEEYCKGRTFKVGDVSYPVIVPSGQYFVMGDNREVSLDSRYSEIGTIEADKIDGHVLFHLYPFLKIGRIK